ncbi:hypothetical protein EC142370_04755 [Escherichia coli O145:H34]|nr:hypothetical protein EC142370_04755 [Escherichia coli O145:H34]
MRIKQVSGAGFFDIKKIVLRCHFTERDNFNTVGFSLWGVEKQVFKVVAAFRLHHVFAKHFDIVAILHGIGDVHDVSGMCAIFVILAAEQRGRLIQPGRVKGAEIFRQAVQLLINIRLQQVKHGAGREGCRLVEGRHPPVNILLHATAGIFCR